VPDHEATITASCVQQHVNNFLDMKTGKNNHANKMKLALGLFTKVWYANETGFFCETSSEFCNKLNKMRTN